MEQYGNSTSYNFESVLRQNILNSDYFRNDCMKLTTWSELIDAVYEEVDFVEPWMGGNMRGPSTAFCLLTRLCQLKPTEAEVEQTITHQDSPYIRAVSGTAFDRQLHSAGGSRGQRQRRAGAHRAPCGRSSAGLRCSLWWLPPCLPSRCPCRTLYLTPSSSLLHLCFAAGLSVPALCVRPTHPVGLDGPLRR